MYNIVAYCGQSYFTRFQKTIKNWCDQRSVANIYIYTDNEVSENQIYEKIIYKNIFKESTCFGVSCARKAESLKYFINNNKFENILLLDIDCLIVKDLDDLFNEDFNIAVTIYPEVKPRYQTNNISSGFVVLKNCNQAKDFINQWVERQKNLHNAPSRDQRALSELVTDLYKNKNDIYKIKLLNGNIWNSHPYNNGIGYVKEWLHRIKIYQPYILHFASNTISNNQTIDDALMAIDG